MAGPLMDAAGRSRRLIAEKGYDANAQRKCLNGEGSDVVIPGRSNRKVPIDHEQARSGAASRGRAQEALVAIGFADQPMDTDPMQDTTRTRIIGAAEALFYEQGLRSVSVDAIAERAGVTKRTLYYHFDSKDDLIAAYLAARDVPTVERYRAWLGGHDRPLPERITTMFSALAAFADRPKWQGCGFTRAAVELAGQPGHPAVVMAADHKKRFENWLTEELRGSGVPDPGLVGRQVMILLEGAIAQMLIHRDVSYATAAGKAAAALVAAELPGPLEGAAPAEARST